jgi:hypothetical protein
MPPTPWGVTHDSPLRRTAAGAAKVRAPAALGHAQGQLEEIDRPNIKIAETHDELAQSFALVYRNT